MTPAPSPASRVARLSPVQTTFFGSLLLSLVAVFCDPTLNRDGVLYVETARIFLSDGFAAALGAFNWPFLSLLIAVVSKLTGIGIENAAHLVNALFMAGACALLVAAAGRRLPAAVWPICLTVLALPGLNHYREELLREYGGWFFVMLAFWLALRWDEAPSWGKAVLAQLALLVAALFRPEALVFFAALVGWQAFSAPAGERVRRVLMIVGVPLALAAVAAVAAFLSGQFDAGSRLTQAAHHFNPVAKRALFDLKAQALAAALLPYARPQAPLIVLVGSLAIIPLRFLSQLGPFVVPGLLLLRRGTLPPLLSRLPLFAWALAAHLVVLSTFVIDMQFLAGRYVATLSLFAAPFIGAALGQAMARYPRWKNAVVVAALALALANVVEFGQRQSPLREAGKWLAANVGESPRVYLHNTRLAYYAGWKIDWSQGDEDREQASAGLAQGRYDTVVLEVSARDKAIEPWLSANGLEAIQRFKGPGKGSVIVATRKAAR